MRFDFFALIAGFAFLNRLANAPGFTFAPGFFFADLAADTFFLRLSAACLLALDTAFFLDPAALIAAFFSAPIDLPVTFLNVLLETFLPPMIGFLPLSIRALFLDRAAPSAVSALTLPLVPMREVYQRNRSRVREVDPA
ncbi:MAG: hypothetical protein P8Y53_24575 [Pseudolabrys sp.]